MRWLTGAAEKGLTPHHPFSISIPDVGAFAPLFDEK